MDQMDVCVDGGGGANTPVAFDPLDPWANCLTYQHPVKSAKAYIYTCTHGRQPSRCTEPPCVGKNQDKSREYLISINSKSLCGHPNVVAESPMRIMYEATVTSGDVHPAVEQAVMVALWSILSNSEQARSIFKNMGLAVSMKYAESDYSEGSYVDAALSRGQEALQILLQ